jgi:hypothetical protein
MKEKKAKVGIELQSQLKIQNKKPRWKAGRKKEPRRKPRDKRKKRKMARKIPPRVSVSQAPLT